MPSPRKIAEKVNESSLFADGEAGFDAIAGCPTSVAGTRPQREEGANPTNPSTPPAPARNLKR
jgi:hypothetical protein